MPKTTMTIKYVNPPKPGKQRGNIKGTDDQVLGVFADKLHLFEAGGTYEIEYTETQSGGVTYLNVKSATRVADAPAASPASPAASNGNQYYRETCPTDAERMFVCSTLNAFIKAGKIGLDKKELGAATLMLRGLWQYTFVANGAPQQEQRQARG